jgi:hypothetical protein
VLIEARGAEVPLREILPLAAQYNARIWSLRKIGFKIVNRTEEVDGARRSWFRLIPGPVQVEPSPAPAAEHVFPVNSQTKSAGDANSEPAQELLPFGDLRHG